MIKNAKFNIGDLVRHQQLGYRAVIIDADPIFQASGRYNPQANKRAFAARNPWYRLLVDNCSQITYVEECHLTPDSDPVWIDNPNVGDYLVEKRNGYLSNSKRH